MMGVRDTPTYEAACLLSRTRRPFETGFVEWKGHLPCVCESQQGCHQHNPNGKLIYRNPLLPPKSQSSQPCEQSQQSQPSAVKGFLNSVRNRSRVADIEKQPDPPKYEEKETQCCSDFVMQIPFDLQSVRTLAPAHPNMPYHLAFYHLHAARSELGDNVKRAFIPKLSCNGVFHHLGREYFWSSGIYFDQGRFKQKLKIEYIIRKGSGTHEEKFIGCPHTELVISNPTFKVKDGFTQVKIDISGKAAPEGYVQDPREISGRWGGSWASSEGRHKSTNDCSVCQTDLHYAFEGFYDELHVLFLVYRDLGPGDDRNDRQWIRLVAGQGHPDRERPKFFSHEIEDVVKATEEEQEKT